MYMYFYFHVFFVLFFVVCFFLFFSVVGYGTIHFYSFFSVNALRKHAYSNILKILPPKNEKFQIKNSNFLHISAQNIDCGYPLEPPLRGGSNAYPQSMFLSRNQKNNVYPCKPQVYGVKVEFKGVKII